MRRREFITLFGGAVAVWPLAARAQQIPVVGFLNSGAPEANASSLAAFRQGLREAGYVDGRNLAIELRWAQDDLNRLPELARDLVARGVAVIAAPGGTMAVRAAKTATSTIPIVFMVAGDPVQLGLVASLNRPGGNLTGLATLNNQIAAKRLGLLRDLLPGATRFVVIVEPTAAGSQSVGVDIQTPAANAGVGITVLNVLGTAHDIDLALADLRSRHIDGILVNPSPLFGDLRKQFTEIAARHGMPAIYWDSSFPHDGGLMSYGPSLTDEFRQVGVYTGRIVKGEKPAELPVAQPTQFDLVINLKTAKALGLVIPPSLLAAAGEVIE
jgi:putative ABC transport system substrate-binding protein